MHKKLVSTLKSLVKPLLGIALVLALALGHADGALAAGSGRMGGGSFRMPSRSTYSAPRSYAPGPSYGGGYGGGFGGGFGFPFLMPVFGIGGGFGGLFTILIGLAVANFLIQSFRRANDGDSLGGEYSSPNPTISVAKVQVGLLAGARTLQADLNRIAAAADTSTPQGLTQVLQETTLSLLRHPEYWVYGGSETQQARLQAAEAKFNQLSLAERSKFSEETLSNFNGSRSLKSAAPQGALPEAGGVLTMPESNEYIVVTLLAATQGDLKLPPVNSADDLRRAISQLGAISSDRLMAVEVLWAPQADGDTLTSEDMLVNYANLKLV